MAKGGKDKEDAGGPSKNQLKGLTYNQNKPKFLQNIATALGGASASSGRPAIPTRPDAGDEDENDFVDEDLGDEAPQVVVLNEGRHMTSEEAEQAKKDAPPPELTESKPVKQTSFLRFSSSEGSNGLNKGKRKARPGAGYEEEEEEPEENGGDAFSDLVKRAKTDPTAATAADISKRKGEMEKKPSGGRTEQEKAAIKKAPLTKEERSAMKAKRKAAKKMLSFED